MTRSTAVLGTILAACFAAAAQAQTASATLAPTAGNTTAGSVTFTQKGDKVTVNVNLSGLAPGGHGFHVHEKGDCSAPDAMSAGGHFNPKSAAHHGGPSAPVRHGGDLGNMQVDSNGRGLLVVAVGDLTMDNVVGRSIVVHQTVDDLKTDPAGNSGARVACGVIQAK